MATLLRPLLEGQLLCRVHLRDVARSQELSGQHLLQVETYGKHTIFHLEDQHLLRVHLGMHGSWHRYSVGEAWRRPKSQALVVFETKAAVVVCFEAMEVELFPTSHRRWHRQLCALGPDLLSEPEPDWSLILQRARSYSGAHLGELLIDQRVAAGLGNVYKSELAFMGPLRKCEFTPSERSLSPWLAQEESDDTTLVGLFQRGRRLLKANLGGWPRTTRAPADQVGRLRLYVYGRTQAPCWRCRTPLKCSPQGLQNRLTYWCPTCQR